jgi:hypothetical protein
VKWQGHLSPHDERVRRNYDDATRLSCGCSCLCAFAERARKIDQKTLRKQWTHAELWCWLGFVGSGGDTVGNEAAAGGG